MISIILAASPQCKRRAKQLGFQEQTILVRHESILSNDMKGKEQIESDIRKIQPYQFMVGDYWGMCNPD